MNHMNAIPRIVLRRGDKTLRCEFDEDGACNYEVPQWVASVVELHGPVGAGEILLMDQGVPRIFRHVPIAAGEVRSWSLPDVCVYRVKYTPHVPTAGGCAGTSATTHAYASGGNGAGGAGGGAGGSGTWAGSAGTGAPSFKGAFRMSVPCAREGCGHVTVYPIGDVDPKQVTCGHVFDLDRIRGMFVCRGCTLEVSMRPLLDAGISLEQRYDAQGNALADRAQALKDENTKLLVENAQLRRTLERERTKRNR